VNLAEGLRQVGSVEVVLSLSTGAEILRTAAPPRCDLPAETYETALGFLRRMTEWPRAARPLAQRLRDLGLDAAICAMPAPLDLLIMSALRRARVPTIVVIHDADTHPGDGRPFQMALQRRQARRADALVALTGHVANRLHQQGLLSGEGSAKPLFRASLPPLVFGPAPPLPGSHGGILRLLSFGRLLPYKGLDLLADALCLLGPAPAFTMRIVGSGPESAALARLRALPDVSVENRWVPEDEVGELLAWADALVLSHTEASQSGVAAAAIAARRWVVSTRVGGLDEQLGGERLARLCQPNPASLAGALRSLLLSPPMPSLASNDPRAAWREVADGLIRQIEERLLGRSVRVGRFATTPAWELAPEPADDKG
jgi:glycosyltransferase involved in cell wall biosynthesis